MFGSVTFWHTVLEILVNKIWKENSFLKKTPLKKGKILFTDDMIIVLRKFNFKKDQRIENIGQIQNKYKAISFSQAMNEE